MRRFQPDLFHKMTLIAILCSAALLTACAQPRPSLDTRLQVRLANTLQASDRPENQEERDDAAISTALAADPTPPFQPIKPLSDTARERQTHHEPQLFFDDTPSLTVGVDVLPLHDFLHRVFGDLLNVNYVIGSRVPENERISLNLQHLVSPRQLFRTVVDILHGLKINVREKDGVFHIEPAPERAALTMGFGSSPDTIPTVPGQVRQLIPLRYVRPDNVVFALANIPGVRIDQHAAENALQVTGSREGVAQVMQFLSVLDRPAMRGRYAGIARLAHRTPEEMVVKVGKTLQIEGIPVASRTESGGLHLVPLHPVGMLGIFAAERQWLQRAQYWIELLDVPLQADERRYFIYAPQNSSAADLLETLENILGTATQRRTARSEDRDGLDLFQPVSVQRDAPSAPADAAADEQRAAPQTGGALDQVRLSIDRTRNALIVYAAAEQYRDIESLLKRLDVMPPQVLIEATVAEVTLVDDLRFGLEWYIRNTDRGQSSILSTLDGLGLGAAGLTLAAISDSDKFRLLVNALAEEELVQVLSSPRITVRDGKTASITVGTQVPVVTSETARVDAAADERVGVVRTYQYRTTGVTLKLTPIVHARNVVTLEIAQDVSEPSASGGENPLILNRTLSTTVVATSGQTLVIGGLIKESKGIKHTKVPLLGDLPLIGHLFKSTTRGGERTELVVLITPHILHSAHQADALREALFESFLHLKWEKD